MGKGMLEKRSKETSGSDVQEGIQASDSNWGKGSSKEKQRQVFNITATCMPPDQQAQQPKAETEVDSQALTARSRLDSGEISIEVMWKSCLPAISAKIPVASR